MERLILLLLSPAIFAERLKTSDSNDEPFLPIYPTYPYNPKLIKRASERELATQLTPESYEAPKEDDKDSYSASYNYQRDPYYPNYNPYPKNISPSLPSPAYNQHSYNEDPYAYMSSPYVAYNPYPTPYAVNPVVYPASSYQDYYYQPPYYYPHYFNHALFPPPPPPSPASLPSEGVDYHETSSQDSSAETEDDKQDKDQTSKKPKEDETNQDGASAGQFVDGGNYISGNSRDLDGQSSTYKVASPYNQLEQDVQAKNPSIPLPKTTYRVISVAGQPVGPDYPLPAQYVKAQQMEQLMSQGLTTILTQDTPQQAGQSYESNTDTLSAVNDGSDYANQDTYDPNTQAYTVVPDVRTKTGVTYVINSADGISKVNNGEQVNPQVAPAHATSNKNAKYRNHLYIRKPATQTIQPQTTLDLSQVTYVPQRDSRNRHRERVADNRPADQADEYDASQSYTAASSSSGSKRQQNYGNRQRQAGSAYRGKDFVVATQTPRTYSYQYSAYKSGDQTTTAQQQDNVNSGDGDFGTKQYNKG